LSSHDHPGLAPRARGDDEPVFDEPWQAQALGLAFVLVDSGRIRPETWSQTLGAELRRREAAGAPDTPQTYYEAVLAAVEQLSAGFSELEQSEFEARIEEWRRAYLNTPHGRPVELAAGRRK